CLPNTTALIKSTSSFVSSPCLYLELTAIEIVATGVPPGVYRTSGSLVRFPIRMMRLNISACLHLCRRPSSLFCSNTPQYLFGKGSYLFTAKPDNHEFEDRIKNFKVAFDLADSCG